MLKLPRRRACLDRIKPYVPGKPVEEVKRELDLDDVIKLASNENPLGPSPMALEALAEALPALNYYPDGTCFLLKKALASRLDLKENQLIFGNGSDEVLKLLAEAYLEPGDGVIVPAPSFSEYEFVTRIMGGEVEYAPLKSDFSYDLEKVLDMVTDRTRLIFVCTPNNPTGTIVTGKELAGFMRKLPQGVIVVIDEAYAEYVSDVEYPRSLEYVRQGAPVIVLRTFSKIYGLAGLRIGYGAAPAELIADLSRVCEPFNVNQAAQVAALAALDDGEHLRRSIDLVEEGRVQMARGLEDIGLQPVPSQANFYFVDTGFDARQVFDRLLRRGVIVRSGDIFGYPTFIRVNFGLPGENARFLKALGEVLGELKGNS